MTLLRIHHVAVICSDYEVSRHFYCHILGLKIIAENYRIERRSHKLDLALPDGSQLELFSFPDPPPRPTQPEARGLRHLAFAVSQLDPWLTKLAAAQVPVEAVRTDEYTGCRFVFLADPDGLPIELYEVGAPNQEIVRSTALA
ncbi:SMU1112c/YaeR family gloxylase I-like metalloprotein [Leptolyngbya iicbica]|uniref:VOC family protein n=2 Tax=Cyanophyceae TaxID=3028117 RepID=A0A4Q7EHN2_9CYAN|nr:VOC family protein [Leptolyngbya sp. LK]RZM82812.1 VOC family protein [Leptolyngbya sp. LK]